MIFHDKNKIKKKLEKEDLRNVLHAWLRSLDEEGDTEVEIQGEKVVIPSHVFSTAEMEFEFETKGDKKELELEVKWKEDRGKAVS